MAGKGDRYRKVNMKRYGENYDRIFRKVVVKGKDKKKKTDHHNV